MKTPILPFILLAMFFLCSCNKKRMHNYSADPPTRHADYLTYCEITKTVEGMDTIMYYSWEVLQFNPYHTTLPKWNTMHIHWPVEVLFWTELPNDPIGTSFESTSGTLKPPTK